MLRGVLLSSSIMPASVLLVCSLCIFDHVFSEHALGILRYPSYIWAVSYRRLFLELLLQHHGIGCRAAHHASGVETRDARAMIVDFKPASDHSPLVSPVDQSEVVSRSQETDFINCMSPKPM